MSESATNLAILGDRPAPSFLAGDIETLLALPSTARTRFWKVLGECLDEQLPENVDAKIDEFAAQHDADGRCVAEAIRGCRYLLLEAARRNVEEHVLAADLGVLGGEHAKQLREIVLENFARAREQVRPALIRRALLDHGRLLDGARLRLDHMTTSQDGALGASVALLTLSYREAESRSRFTVHAELGKLAELRDALNALLEPFERPVDGDADPL